MKKIPTLFEKVYENNQFKEVTHNLSSLDLQVVLDGKCVPTVKKDGSCCAYFNNTIYKRYDAKHGKKPPLNAIPCCEPDPISGHWPHWVPITEFSPDNKWFIEAFNNYKNSNFNLVDGTYEVIGPHFQGNPYYLDEDTLYFHGSDEIDDLGIPSYESIKEYLKQHYIEGIVFWYKGEPLCKVKRRDFRFPWNLKRVAKITFK